MKAIDLFAGLGGNSTGATMAGCEVVWAANHWPDAVAWHKENHPEAIHVCQDLHQARWELVPSHDLLMASPCCQGHTRARGKNKPEHDASRSTAWAPISAIEFHRPEVALIENVKEFLDWTLFTPWRLCLEAMGYSVAPHIVDAADFGVPQHRERMIMVCTKSKHPLLLNLPQQEHRTARSIIDLDSGKWSPVKKKNRSPKTLERVARGRERYGDLFVMPYYGSGSGLTGRDIDRPIGTLTTRDRWAVVNGDQMRMLTKHEVRAGMGFPEETKLPDNHKLAVHMLGNAVPPLMMKGMIEAVKAAA